ncbi:sugar phosphate isomerase/epimerase family protein [Haladaptatus sp. GCM10025707]|uniref:sugar phosphate isomerase/epimerase family protein n=1 Tax=unclassified Haladaptatus TaxID=2622732 RepID=UPI0023E81434|nr:sugar phosphate isomerase/epimerase [Haladaptatus sp. QDMS2]
MRTAIQLYTLRALDESLDQLVARVASTPLDGVEFAYESMNSPTDVASTLASHDLELANLSASVETLETDEAALAEACETLDCETVVLPYLDPSYFDSRDRVEATADLLSGFARTLDSHGLRFLYHNHAHEFADVDGEVAFDVLLDRVDDRVEFELDLGWVGTAGEDPYARLEALGDRVPSIHVKDMYFATGEFASLGDGDLDASQAMRIAQAQGVEWAIFEHDEPADPVVELENGASRLVNAVERVNSR